MEQYIPKSAVVAEIKRRMDENSGKQTLPQYFGMVEEDLNILSFLDTLEVKDSYEQCIQYPSIEDGIKAHAETYSFNIESELFHQLTKEQQKLWRKEIEQACISGGNAGVGLARDIRYKENVEVKDVDLDREIELIKGDYEQVDVAWNNDFDFIAKHFFELGLLSTITEKDCKLIWNIGDEIPQNMPEKDFFKELLRRYKEKKVE